VIWMKKGFPSTDSKYTLSQNYKINL